MREEEFIKREDMKREKQLFEMREHLKKIRRKVERRIYYEGLIYEYLGKALGKICVRLLETK